MNELDRRRLDRLNKEYHTSAEYIGPMFSNKRIFWMGVLCLVGVAMVAYGLLD